MLRDKNRHVLSLPGSWDRFGLACCSPEPKSLRDPCCVQSLSLIIVSCFCCSLRAASCLWQMRSVWQWRPAGSWTGRSWCTRRKWHWRPTKSLKSSKRRRGSEWTPQNSLILSDKCLFEKIGWHFDTAGRVCPVVAFYPLSVGRLSLFKPFPQKHALTFGQSETESHPLIVKLLTDILETASFITVRQSLPNSVFAIACFFSFPLCIKPLLSP